MKKQGFTLIELLAVIVILAVIALIAIPVITSVIDKAKKGALKDSAYGILNAGEMYLAKNMSEGINDTLEFTCSNGVCINGDKKINYKGQIETGRIRIYSDSKIELCITDNKYSALKTVDNKEVKVETGTCKYEELSYDVAALVSKDDYDKLQNDYNNIMTELTTLKSLGDATESDILAGKTALVNGEIITGINVAQLGTMETVSGYTGNDTYKTVTFTKDYKAVIVMIQASTCANISSWSWRNTLSSSTAKTLFDSSVANGNTGNCIGLKIYSNVKSGDSLQLYIAWAYGLN